MIGEPVHWTTENPTVLGDSDRTTFSSANVDMIGQAFDIPSKDMN